MQKHHSCRLARRLGLYQFIKRAGIRQERIDVTDVNDGHFVVSQCLRVPGCQTLRLKKGDKTLEEDK